MGVFEGPDLDPTDWEAVRRQDPAAIAEREAEIERAKLGRFRPIWE